MKKLLLTLLLMLPLMAGAQEYDPPIMGWSSWNIYRVNISDTLIKRQADAMVKLGLKDVGYRYVNVDDGFFGHRNATGKMVAHATRFPLGLRPVADHIHSLGLKAGIYSDAGANTCGSRWDNDKNGFGAGLYGHERQDARLYFKEWGFDFIKIDYCGAGQDLDLDEQKRYTEIYEAIKAEGCSDVSINICRWTFPGTWAAGIAKSWRISPDIRPRWESVKHIIDMNLYLSAYCRGGHFNDMDMLEIGRGLKPNEEEVHFGMWCMMSSPLLIGCDLTSIPEQSLKLLKNEELIALDQDPLCLQAYVAMRQGEGYVMVKDLQERNGLVRAVALYNPSDSAIHFNVPLAAIELGGKTKLRDLIGRKDMKHARDSIAMDVPARSVRIMRAEGLQRLECENYEAERAYLPLFDNLGKRKKQISYERNDAASGGMVVSHIGGEADNVIRWDDVWSKDGGEYELTIHYVPVMHRQMTVSVNGWQTRIDNLAQDSTTTLNISLKAGYNTIEIGNSYAWAPDIDRITLHKKTTRANLTVEHRISPIGIDVKQPRFGWLICSRDSGVVQTSYRIIVASTKTNIEKCKGDVWDSGIVKSDSSQWVAYRGKPLQANSKYWWRVLVATNKDKAKWSEIADWTTGMMGDKNWQGEWIGLDSLVEGDSQARHSRIVSRQLRKAFDCKEDIKRATLHISGLGLYSARINGKRVGKGVLTPAPTDYTKTVAYDTYDITNMLDSNNAIGVTLAGGHYFAQTQNHETNVRTTYGFPKLRAMIIIEYGNGKTDTIATDNSWTISTDSPTRYANEYDGELYDSRLEKDFSLVDFDDSHWGKARIVAAPGGTMAGNITPQMCVYTKEKPTATTRIGNRLIIDFGTNGTGRISIFAKGNAGDTIKIRHAEQLNADGQSLYTDNLRSAEATARLICNSKAQRWQPEFTYYGFRYAEITAPDGTIAIDSIRRELIADEMSLADNSITFMGDSSAMILNGIVANARRGIMSNYKGFPIDCPQRDERMPWLGDRTIGCTGESYIADNHSLYAKWVEDICLSQRPDGNISDVAPAYWRLYTSNVTWPAALPFAADMLYRQYGDAKPMRKAYDSIIKWLNFLNTKKREGNLIVGDKYGDWCVPPEGLDIVLSKDPTRKTDGRLLASTYYYYICRTMSRYARMFGKSDDAKALDARADTTLMAINAEFLNDGKYANNTPTANILPLAMGIVPDEWRKSVETSLLQTIVERDGCHVGCGVIGIGWIMRTLADMGRNDLAYKIASTTTYPSWGYMLNNGATTIWELWNGNTANPSMNSGNHVMLLGDLLPWCFERLGGIVPDTVQPGFKHFFIKPDFSIESLNGVSVSHGSIYGKIVSRWQRKGETIEWHVEIPANTTATLHFPNGETKVVGSGIFDYYLIFLCSAPLPPRG